MSTGDNFLCTVGVLGLIVMFVATLIWAFKVTMKLKSLEYRFTSFQSENERIKFATPPPISASAVANIARTVAGETVPDMLRGIDWRGIDWNKLPKIGKRAKKNG